MPAPIRHSGAAPFDNHVQPSSSPFAFGVSDGQVAGLRGRHSCLAGFVKLPGRGRQSFARLGTDPLFQAAGHRVRGTIHGAFVSKGKALRAKVL